jgi:hypothetical protein
MDVDTEFDMAVDVTLWIILAAAVGFVYCGCVCTAGNSKPS